MAYRVIAGLRLYARDGVFLLRYLARRVLPGWATEPVYLCNSYPKSGTHLLHQILLKVPGARRWPNVVSVLSLSGYMNTPSHLRWKLGSVPPRSVVRAHLSCNDTVLAIVKSRPCVRYFIYRDPRDIAVSHFHWVMKEKASYLNRIYREHLRSDEERLMASIVGVPIATPFAGNLSSPPLFLHLRKWLGWLEDPRTLAVRFEDLVGSRGGGDDDRRAAVIRQILEHAGVSLSQEQLVAKFSDQALDPAESHTFRRGRIGGWREAFTPEHTRVFKATAGDLLVRLGYEQGDDW